MLLEPIQAVSIFVPSDALARASALVTARRGQILGFEGREGWPGWETLRALIPEAEIGDLIVELRSATAGVGAFESRFDHLAELVGKAGGAGDRGPEARAGLASPRAANAPRSATLRRLYSAWRLRL